MKKFYIGPLVAIGLLTFSNPAESQILKKIGQKIEQRAERAIDDMLTDESADQSARESQEAEPISRHVSTGTGPFSNIPVMPYDFAPGSEVVFFDDFSEEPEGRMASRWTSNGMGAVATVSGFEGTWLRLYDANTYKIKELVRIPENFTLEFDLLVLADNKDQIVIDFGFDHQKGVSRHYYLADQNPVNVEASFRFDRFTFTSNELGPRKSSDVTTNMSYFVNDVMNVQLRVEGDRMAVFVNEFKVLDTEMVNPATKKYFYIAVENEQNLGEVYVGNVRIAQL